MKKKQYEFDLRNVSVRKVGFDILKLLIGVLKVFIISLSLFIVIYAVMANFISTDTEKRLRREIRAYEKVYPQIEPRMKLIEESLSAVEVKDNDIYESVFHNAAPSVDPISSLQILHGADTIPDAKIVNYTKAKVDRLAAQSEMVRQSFEEIYRSLAAKDFVLPPMILPVDDFSYPQTGASSGPRLNPFLNAEVRHNGIDLIVPRGTPVHATADGTVTNVTNSTKGDGNCVTISHAGGYETRYLHLSEIRVQTGQSVKKGRVIGASGMSGQAFAPHLHYEVILNGQAMDPVNYIFASVSPNEYSNMLYMSVNTRQSMD